MSFKVYDYQCTVCDAVDEDRWVRGADADEQTCELCGEGAKRLLCAPRLDLEGMARAGCPGALETTGDRIEKKHRSVDQHHRKAS